MNYFHCFGPGFQDSYYIVREPIKSRQRSEARRGNSNPPPKKGVSNYSSGKLVVRINSISAFSSGVFVRKEATRPPVINIRYST